MNYVQNPYFTDENVEKEKGIIAQEIKMYDDEPGWQVYMNAMKLMYKNNPVNIDIAGSVESISNINKDILYKAYNTFMIIHKNTAYTLRKNTIKSKRINTNNGVILVFLYVL